MNTSNDRVTTADRRRSQTVVMVLDVVARRSGFGSAETVRRPFVRELGATPGAYRARFHGNATARFLPP
jgi:transcriptional regulator GlxA family with amidase domain